MPTAQSWISELSIDPQRRTTRIFSVDYPVASSGNAVTLSVLSGPASVSGNIFTLTGEPGIVTVAASQAGNSSFSPLQSTYTFAVADEIVHVYRRIGSSSEPYNEIEITGDNYIYGRLVSGKVPAGLNWIGTAAGVKFWGTPATDQDSLAIFEGPYPPNFRSSRTIGGWPAEPTTCDAQVPSGNAVQVFEFSVAFVSTELPAESFNMGEVLYHLARNPTFGAQRWKWRSNGRFVNPVTIPADSFGSSDTKLAPTPNAAHLFLDNGTNVITANRFSKSDMMASDWGFGSIPNNTFNPIVTNWAHAPSGRLITEAAREQYISPETPDNYASFNGIAINQRSPIAFNSQIPIGPNQFVWGEFFLPDGPSTLKILFYTRIGSKVTTLPYAQVGIKSLMRVCQSGYLDYRLPAAAHEYDFLSDPTSSVTSQSVSIEGKHVIFNINPINSLFSNDDVSAYLLITL